MTTRNFKKLSDCLKPNLETIIIIIAPEGERRGDNWVMLNPRRHDRKLGSFMINLRTGIWKDFATDEGGGDIVSFIAYIYNLSQAVAYDYIAKMIGRAANDNF